ncbi:osiris 9 [Culex quinquefasciatus]|uniref:Osiris 9 n=2 Tax=Culex pipiens complex TaxID=518105 RepID=B0WLV8_CULQU|nr:uncharacterized protein LOC120430515 [Culex pipiens pallens]EDS30693.1 osiris 9 [Culex quinquefasciatus]|eukprot:XP_001849692.1 osiris 9 [Culex quinquefasciatus]
MKQFVVLFAVLAVAAAAPSETDGLLSSALKFVKDCGDKSMVLCVKERALQYVDNVQGNIEVTEGITLVETEKPATGRSLNEVDLPAEPEARESEIDSLLVDRAARFLGSHTLQFSVPKESIADMQRSLDEARGKKKKVKKLLLPLLLLFKLKAAALLPLAIGFLALIAFKALIVGKIALILSAIIGLKKLFDKKPEQSYEVVAHPHYSHSTSFDDHHGYARSLDAQNLAYAAHTQ